MSRRLEQLFGELRQPVRRMYEQQGGGEGEGRLVIRRGVRKRRLQLKRR
jgi:hypothetical protein